MTRPVIPIVRLAHGEGLALPDYASTGAAGMDLIAAVTEPADLTPGARMLVPTGIAIALPEGLEAQVRPRSGLALRHGVTVLNAPGTIDPDYRGEIAVIPVNFGTESFTVARGLRIAQLVIAPFERSVWAETIRLPESERGAGGFGSTGGHAQGS